MNKRDELRCGRCGRRIGVYLNEVSGRYLAHKFPVALHRALPPMNDEGWSHHDPSP